MVISGHAPVPPVSPDPPGLGGMFVKVDIDAREGKPLGVDMHGYRGMLLGMDTAFAMAKGPASIGSAGGANKATIAVPKALGPGAYSRAKGQ